MEVDFEMDQLFDVFPVIEKALSIDRILADNSTTMRTVCRSGTVLAEVCAGWKLQRRIKLLTWSPGSDAVNDDEVSYSDTDMKGMEEVGKCDELNGVVVGRVVLVLRKANSACMKA